MLTALDLATRTPYPMTDTHITVTASIFIGNMTPAQRTAISTLPAGDIEELTGFKLVAAPHPYPYRDFDGELVNFYLWVDTAAPGYGGQAFVKEDFIAALLDVLNIHSSVNV